MFAAWLWPTGKICGTYMISLWHKSIKQSQFLVSNGHNIVKLKNCSIASNRLYVYIYSLKGKRKKAEFNYLKGNGWILSIFKNRRIY